MILKNHPLTGTLFLPTLGIAACIFVAGYWLSKYKDQNEKKRSAEEELQEEDVSVKKTLTKKKKTHKKHACGCGTTSSQDTTPPNKINIFYGTVTGKSKVAFKISQNSIIYPVVMFYFLEIC